MYATHTRQILFIFLFFYDELSHWNWVLLWIYVEIMWDKIFGEADA